jgi:hypothetical protein
VTRHDGASKGRHPADHATATRFGGADAAAATSTSERIFLAVSALLFAASVAVTIVWCAPMSGMGAMPMPGGWTMSMAWMRMPGQTWSAAAASFLGMWVGVALTLNLRHDALDVISCL